MPIDKAVPGKPTDDGSKGTELVLGAEAEDKPPTTLHGWTQWLRDKEMPIFSRTAQCLNRTMEDGRAGIPDLARIILEDPTLTAKLLKFANSPYYNPSRQHLATVTRAVILLGLNIVRELALACSFIDEILGHNKKEEVLRELACALHAAVQAKSLAVLACDPQPEEVFIAALLHNIGQISFWCFEREVGDRIRRLTEQQRMAVEQAEKTVLGFHLDQLGASLSKTWGLGGLIEESFTPKSRRTQLVRLGYQLARSAPQGWSSEAMGRCLKSAAELTGKPQANLLAQLQNNAENAIKLASQFGAEKAAAYIPVANSGNPPAVSVPAAESAERSDADLMQIMREITNLLCGEFDLNVVFEMIIEGVFRGMAMDRVLFALLTPDRKRLKEKSSLGWPPVSVRGIMQINVTESVVNIFSRTLENNEHLWLKQDAAPETRRLYTPEVIAQFGQHECLLSPVGVDKRIIGLFYADRAFGKKPITPEVFADFKQLTRQASIALKLRYSH
jgi:HD-like signal output (HDOD) protein